MDGWGGEMGGVDVKRTVVEGMVAKHHWKRVSE